MILVVEKIFIWFEKKRMEGRKMSGKRSVEKSLLRKECECFVH